MAIIFEELEGNVEAPPARTTEEPRPRPSRQRDPEWDRVRSLTCRNERRAARLRAD